MKTEQPDKEKIIYVATDSDGIILWYSEIQEGHATINIQRLLRSANRQEALIRPITVRSTENIIGKKWRDVDIESLPNVNKESGAPARLYTLEELQAIHDKHESKDGAESSETQHALFQAIRLIRANKKNRLKVKLTNINTASVEEFYADSFLMNYEGFYSRFYDKEAGAVGQFATKDYEILITNEN